MYIQKVVQGGPVVTLRVTNGPAISGDVWYVWAKDDDRRIPVGSD